MRMIPLLIIVICSVAMALQIYEQMMDTEEEVCWQRLEIATNSTAGKIQTRITDNLNFLSAVSDAYIWSHNISDLQAVGEYLDSVMSRTIFDRIDVILPDNTMITQDGENIRRGGNSSFEQLAVKGTHVTPRVTSSFTGKEVICCVTPIRDGDRILGLLVGTIDCDTMSKLFEVFTYGQSCQLFVIDRSNGNYIMDNWHEELSNVYERGPRQSVYTGEMIDLAAILTGSRQERVAYYSRTNGEKSFQYNAPVEDFDWMVCVVVQEDVAFANMQALEKDLLQAGRIGTAVLLVYVLWNVIVNVMASRNEARANLLEFEKAKNTARATFISNMSHDIKTPLNGIVGMLQIIKNHPDDQDLVDDCLNKIGISAKYLSTLASDMLDISEIENDKRALPQEPLQLDKLLDDLAAMVAPQAENAGVAFSMDHSGLQQTHILGSGIHIQRILTNLIGNAIKYSKNVGKQVWVTVTDQETEQAYGMRMYRFVIRDNGIGMSEEFQKKMYKAFEQEVIDARSEYQGYGLGLTIVNQLIHKMGGTIHLESAKDAGSTFTVSIPFTVDPTPAPEEKDREQTADISGLRLLLAEDNEFNMEIAHTLLTDAGALVDKAVNGRLALDAFAATPAFTYDAVIMDVMMPEMDGLEATRAIRAMEREDSPTVPIIAMTANTFSEDIKKSLEAGMNAHIAKPLDIAELIGTIAKLTK